MTCPNCLNVLPHPAGTKCIIAAFIACLVDRGRDENEINELIEEVNLDALWGQHIGPAVDAFEDTLFLNEDAGEDEDDVDDTDYTYDTDEDEAPTHLDRLRKISGGVDERLSL